MSIERIEFNLKERFAAPLPEFYRRRIVFWHDEERQFEQDMDELDLPGVKILRLTGSNNFAAKKLLLHDDLESDYLVYCPLAYASEEDDWLQDIEYYSETFRADFVSMQMEELNIEPSAAMRKAVKLYAKFLESEERRKKLRRLGHSYDKPLALHTDIMAVLAGLNGGSMQDVFIAVLSAGLDRESNEILLNIRKFGSLPAFWELAYKYTGYLDEEDRPLSHFASHLLLTALSQTMNPSVLKGLKRFLSESNKAYCYSLVHEWRGREDNEALFDICRAVEDELHLAQRFDRLEPETLITGDIFPCMNESLLSQLFSEVAEQVVRTDLILSVCENRRTAGWYDRFEDYFDCLFFIGKMELFREKHGAGFHFAQPRALWNAYADEFYRMDAYYRRFYHAFGRTLANSNDRLDDGLKHATEYVEGLYQNWFLHELTASWTKLAAEDFASLGYVSEINKQRDFYRRYVSPASKNARAFVIISDALRYEVASELTERLSRTTKGAAELASMQAVFPSITKFGMAALLPGLHLSADEHLDALMDGRPTRSTADRNAVLSAAARPGIAIQYTDLLGMKKAERRELHGANVRGYAPQDTVRMKVQGGGANYVHGGISLEEMVVPVILFKNLRSSSHDYKEVRNAEIRLLTESRKVANLIFSLEFYQAQPCGDKIQPCTYTIYMTDEDGTLVSDRQKLIADKSSPNASERAFRLRFNLKAGAYDAKKPYRLVIASDTDMQEVEFRIDVALADDFGFDL